MEFENNKVTGNLQKANFWLKRQMKMYANHLGKICHFIIMHCICELIQVVMVLRSCVYTMNVSYMDAS